MVNNMVTIERHAVVVSVGVFLELGAHGIGRLRPRPFGRCRPMSATLFLQTRRQTGLNRHRRPASAGRSLGAEDVFNDLRTVALVAVLHEDVDALAMSVAERCYGFAPIVGIVAQEHVAKYKADDFMRVGVVSSREEPVAAWPSEVVVR
jgi:hypothetical protein